MILNDQDLREKESEKVIAKATASLNRAQVAVTKASLAIQAALKAGGEAQQQLAGRKKGKRA